LFNIFVHDILDYINAPTIGRTTITGQLFTDGLAVSSFTINDLQEAIDQVVKYFKG
jgi:hypothetical protein